MKKEIRIKIQKAQAQALCGIEILPRRRGKQKTDFIKRAYRDEDSNHVNADGDLILSHVRTHLGKTLTPAEQYKMSRFGRKN